MKMGKAGDAISRVMIKYVLLPLSHTKVSDTGRVQGLTGPWSASAQSGSSPVLPTEVSMGGLLLLNSGGLFPTLTLYSHSSFGASYTSTTPTPSVGGRSGRFSV